MNTGTFRNLCWCLLTALSFSQLQAADGDNPPLKPDQPSASRPVLPMPEFAKIIKGLEINPKVLTQPDGEGTTVGLHYKYDRALTNSGFFKKTDVEFSVHSEGLVVVDRAESPNRLLTHGLRLSAIDLLPSRETTDTDSLLQVSNLNQRVQSGYFKPWKNDLIAVKRLQAKGQLTPDEQNELEEKSGRLVRYVDQARPLLKDYGTLEVDEAHERWELNDGSGEIKNFSKALMDRVIKPRSLFLSFDLGGDAETDQSFSDSQLVGSAQLSGKVLIPILDYPFAMLRGGGPPKSPINRYGGPYFWGGAGLVDASGNDARKAITKEDETFARAHFGLFYRTEVFSTTAANAIALELHWRYYHEFDAPKAIRRQNLDNTSYFKATLLFPGNYFLEYTDGKLPLDVEGASTVSVGWRHNF